MTIMPAGPRKSKRISYADYELSDDNDNDKEASGNDSSSSIDLSDNERPKGKRASAKSKVVYQKKDKILDLESFYDTENLVETVLAGNLELPPHLSKLTYYPHTEISWDCQCASNNLAAISDKDQDGNAINIDRNWWLVDSLRNRRVKKSHIDAELIVTKGTVVLDLPKLYSIGGLNKFQARSKRATTVKSMYQEGISFVFDLNKRNLEEAIDNFIATHDYFKKSFPTNLTMDNYPSDFLKLIDQTTGKLIAGMQRKLITSKHVSYFLENPKSDLPISVSCPDFMENINPKWFRLICYQSDSPQPTLSNAFNVQDESQLEAFANIYVYFDTSKFPLLPEKNFQMMHESFKVQSSLASLSSNIPRVVEDKKLKTTALNALEASTLNWMKNVIEQKDDESAHSVSFAESSSIVRFESLPDQLVNFKESSIIKQVSGHYLEKDYSVYGGVIMTDIKKPSKRAKASESFELERKKTIRNLAITLIYQAPLSSLSDLSMSYFQKNFMIPSAATLVVASCVRSIEKWASLVDAFNDRFQSDLSVLVIDSIEVFKTMTWEDILHADIVICSEKLITSFTFHLDEKGYRVGSSSMFRGYFSLTSKEIFHQRAGDGDVDSNNEPTQLLHMKDIIQNLEEWYNRPGSVDMQGIYWHRIVYDNLDSEFVSLQCAADWKWVLMVESPISYPSSLTSFISLKVIEEFEFQAFKNRFVRSITPAKDLPAPRVLAGISLEPSVPDESRANEDEESSAEAKKDKKGKGVAADKKKRKKKLATGSVKSKKAKQTVLSACPPKIAEDAESEDDDLIIHSLDGPNARPGPSRGRVTAKANEDGSADDAHLGAPIDKSLDDGPSKSTRTQTFALRSNHDKSESSVIRLSDDGSDMAVEELPASTAHSSAEHSEKIAQLVSMGFDDVQKCSDALLKYDGNLDRAVNYMLG